MNVYQYFSSKKWESMRLGMTTWNQNIEKNSKLCYMNADSFIKFIKIEDIYVDIAKDSETRLDTDNYEFDRSLPIE